MTQDGLKEAISDYGSAVTQKFAEVAISGEPEDQLRAPLEELIEKVAAYLNFDVAKLSVVGETSLAHLQTRPDFAISYQGTLCGFVEVKAPGKGADPRKFKTSHDKSQWKKLQALPNLIYTDGQEFALWQDGDLDGDVLCLDGDVQTDGSRVGAPSGLAGLFERFLQWHPIAPKKPKQLAEMTARLCRLLRNEVAEQLVDGNDSLTNLASDWRQLLFPEASDGQVDDLESAESLPVPDELRKPIPLPEDGGLLAAAAVSNSTS